MIEDPKPSNGISYYYNYNNGIILYGHNTICFICVGVY